MTLLQRLVASMTLAGIAGAACAQAVAPASAAPPARAASAAQRDASTPTLTVIEDDGVRIEETRLRGQAQRIVVQSKVGSVRAYEIIVGTSGRDPSKDRGAVGQSAWSLFDF
jgi:hypothetical protein